jgi:GTP-binding protein
MFTDSVELTVSSGKGGPGCVAFRREKFVVNGGPNGGDGGKGGDIWFKCDNNTHTLSHFQKKMHIKADNGAPGESSNMTGKSGAKKVVIVPPGTQIIDMDSGEIVFDMLKDGQEELFITGGKGGLGNTHFKSSTNQRPTYAQPGEKGETRRIKLDLKLIADVGLVGFPSSGKSTLLSVVSAAKPKIAEYHFTTLVPNLGIVGHREKHSFVMADIPGIIEGAHLGKGLGLRFLRHIERNSMLLFMVPADSKNHLKEYKILLDELDKYNPELLDKQRFLAISKADMLDQELMNEISKELKGIPHLFFSSVTGFNLQQLKDKIWEILNS